MKLKSVLFQPTNARSKPRTSSSGSLSTVTSLLKHLDYFLVYSCFVFFFKDVFKASKEQITVNKI